MGCIWSDEIDSVLGQGRSLEGLGVRNWALDREQAMSALGRLGMLEVAVLGGDVYTVIGTDIESTLDNWYCNRRSDEAEAHFVERSIGVARNYIATYPGDLDTVFFALVPEVRRQRPD